MRTAKLIILAMLVAFVSVTLAHAGTQVQVNQAAAVKATIKNVNSSTMAAVKVTGYDDAGVKIGQLCKEVYLRGYGNSTAVDFNWNAPAYATGIFWQAKVENKGTCPNAEVPTYDYNDYHHDSDSDDGADSDHH